MGVKFKVDGVTVPGTQRMTAKVYGRKDGVVPDSAIDPDYLERLQAGDPWVTSQAEYVDSEEPDAEEWEGNDTAQVPEPERTVAGDEDTPAAIQEDGGDNVEEQKPEDNDGDPLPTNSGEHVQEPAPSLPGEGKPVEGTDPDHQQFDRSSLRVDPANLTVQQVVDALSEEGVTQADVDATKNAESLDRGTNARKGIMEFELPAGEPEGGE